jgi:RsiW-degrading membrane proteinase PrsW (M82 family)
MNVVTAILAAAIPTAIYSLLLWWLDRYEKEPLSLIMIAFLWGALPAIALALLFELVLAAPLERSPIGPGATQWALAPLVEEPVKALALIGLYRFARHEFDGPLDGIVYGALVGFGFSMTENLLFFLHFGSLDRVLWIRGVLFGLSHAFFTSLVGLALGAARYEQSRQLKGLALAGGLGLAILFHALHNYVVGYPFGGLFLSWLIQSAGVLVVLAVTVLAWRNERRWMEDELGEEVRAGVLGARDYAEITSSPQRLRRQAAAFLNGGWPRFRQVRRLHHLATELAFRKSQSRLHDNCHPADECGRLRAAIVELRASLQAEESAWGEL